MFQEEARVVGTAAFLAPSAGMIGLALAEAFNTDVNLSPLSLIVF